MWLSGATTKTTKTTVNSGPGKRRTRIVDPFVDRDISKLVGIGDPLNKLMDHLVREEESGPQLKMACIVGDAGMGKTTLARLVCEPIKHQFQAWAFVSVTSCRDMTEVLARIYQHVRGPAESSTVAPLAGTKAATAEKRLIDDISNFLKDKRYLVIIDDIWHCGEWETIKKSLPNNNLGSRIVTTSRVNALTDKWRDDFDALVYKIDYSHYRPVFALTNKMIDLNVEMVGEGFDCGHWIVRMCHDMPLAVVCMISAVAKERERHEQQGLVGVLSTGDVQDRIEEQVTRNGIQNTPGYERLVESLELGYNNLPHHMLKTCLLYCSIYPMYHDFCRDELVRRWIAEGFVCMEEAAEDYFDELIRRGFIGKLNLVGENYTMHPMIRNHLRWKLREDNFITFTSDGIPSSPVGRLCIDEYWPSSDAVEPLSGIDWHHIRSLVIFEDAERVPYERLKHLRVLDVVEGGGSLENQHLKDMCGLLRLRHLFVSGGDGEGAITEMPEDNLETPEVRETGITRLPAEISDLKQLKTLDMSFNTWLAELPREMGNLHHVLETLIIRGSKIREQDWEIIWALKKLKTLNVCGNFELSGIPRNIGELQELKNLDVSCNEGITQLPKEIGKLQHLKSLNVSGTGIKELPREMWNLRQLEALNLSYVETITKLPRDIGRLQHLERLDLQSSNVRKIPREIGGLKKLKNLKAQIGTLPFEAGQLPKLERLPKCVRQAWKNSGLVPSLAGEILSFKKADSFGGDGGLVVGRKHMHIPQWIKEHFNNIEYLDIRICKVEERDLKILREMPNLRDLKIRFEAVPREPIAISSGGFAELSFLTVDSRVPRVTFHEGAMPSLFWLQFEFQFYGGPPNTDHPTGIKHLVRLGCVTFSSSQWYRGDSPCISATIDVVRKEAKEHPNEIRFEIFPAKSMAQSSQEGNDACSSSGVQEIQA